MLNRWWIYQQERFPLFKHGLLIAVFGSSAVGYSALVRSPSAVPAAPGAALIAVIVLFFAFLHLRIADEFKDYADDVRFRPYRPVPRGLVTLAELRAVAIAAAIIQLGLTLAVGWAIVPLLLLLWGYMALMTQEFFAPRWLKAHPVIYMLSHMMVMPLMAFYAMACDWVRAGAEFSPAGIWFLAVSFLGGLALELGRKIRAPQDEEPGVETYTALWGRKRAIAAWLSSLLGMGLAALGAAIATASTSFTALTLVILLLPSAVTGWQFQRTPTTPRSHLIELLSGLWTLLLYPALGLLPLL